jgi:hypothetical protein
MHKLIQNTYYKNCQKNHNYKLSNNNIKLASKDGMDCHII